MQKYTLGEVKKTERSFDGKLCQEYLYQNNQNLIIGFKVTVRNVGDVFLRHSVLLLLLLLLLTCISYVNNSV